VGEAYERIIILHHPSNLHNNKKQEQWINSMLLMYHTRDRKEPNSEFP